MQDDEMVLQEKVHTNKTKDLTLICGTHMIEGENGLHYRNTMVHVSPYLYK